MEIHVYQVARHSGEDCENGSIRSYAGEGSFYAANVLHRVAAGLFSMDRNASVHVDVRFVRTVDTETTRLTKWELISDRERESLDMQTFTDSEGNPGVCSVCREDIGTEGKFARHFTVPDYRYPNLGTCPQRVPTECVCGVDGIYHAHDVPGVCSGSE